METDQRKLLTSWREAQEQVGDILAALNETPALLMAAAANPLLALQELGYEVSADVRQLFEDRIRFGQSKAEQVHLIRQAIFDAAGRSFDLDSAEALAEVLSQVLETKIDAPISMADAQPPRFSFGAQQQSDPLERLRGVHPILEPLLQYRTLDASTPRFATPAEYGVIRQGKRALHITKMVAILQRAS